MSRACRRRRKPHAAFPCPHAALPHSRPTTVHTHHDKCTPHSHDPATLSHDPARPRLHAHCHARAEHVTRSRAQRSIGIAAHAAIGRDRRCPENGAAFGRHDRGKAAAADLAGKEPEEHQRNGPQQCLLILAERGRVSAF